MRTSFRDANFEALARLWNEHFPSKYAIDAATLRFNTVESPVFDWGASFIEHDESGELLGFVVVKRSAAELYAGPDPDQAHLSTIVVRDCSIGVDILSDVKRILRQRGIYRLVFGQDSRHFLPGCPVEYGQLRDFLMIEGFEEIGEQVDVGADLAETTPAAKLLPASGEVCARPAAMTDVSALSDFLAHAFPGRWQYDTLTKIEQEGRADFCYLLWVHDEVEGFALLQDETHHSPIAGGVWRAALGESWCTLGPIGVSPNVRGKGLGDALLATALNSMRLDGKRRCLIDWTTLVDWYGKHGFRPENRYRTFALRLDQGSR